MTWRSVAGAPRRPSLAGTHHRVLAQDVALRVRYEHVVCVILHQHVVCARAAPASERSFVSEAASEAAEEKTCMARHSLAARITLPHDAPAAERVLRLRAATRRPQPHLRRRFGL